MPVQESCFICGDHNANRLQEHHIVPRRYGGSDQDVNLVTLCASCHQAIEKLYDESFYSRLGVEKPQPDTRTGECRHPDCGKQVDVAVENGFEFYICGPHRFDACVDCEYHGRSGVTRSDEVKPVVDNRNNGEDFQFLCMRHRVCRSKGCRSRDTEIFDLGKRDSVLCKKHRDNPNFSDGVLSA